MDPLKESGPTGTSAASDASTDSTASVASAAPIDPVERVATAALAGSTAPTASISGGTVGGATLALIEVIDRDGHVRQAWPIRHWPATVGRALDNDIVLTDPHVAAHHFRLDRAGDDGVTLQAGDTVNGLTLDGRRIEASSRAALGDTVDGFELVVGRTRLRLRIAETALAPERLLSAVAVRPLRPLPTLALALVLLAGIAFNAYLDADPDNFVRVAGNALLVGLTGAGLWCGAWALLSKTITRQGHLSWHLRVFVMAALALLTLAVLPGLFAFSLSWPWLTDYSFVATFAVGAAALYFHLLAVEPARPKLLRAVVATGAVVGIALTFWFNVQRTSRVGDELYMSHLFPPSLRIARPLATERFIEGLGPLHALLDKKAKEPAGADPFGAAPAGNRSDDDE